MNQYPGTNFHDLNLDWLLSEMKNCLSEWANTKEDWETMQTENADFKQFMTDQWSGFRDFVLNYLHNLPLTEEVSAKIETMVEDGTLLNLITADEGDGSALSDVAGQWLNAHITQETGYVIDDSLTVPGAAADANATGDAISDLRGAVEPIDASGKYAYFENWYNPDEQKAGQISPNNGSVDPAAASISMCSGLIPVVPGDVLYMSGIKSDGTYLYGNGTISRLAWYNSNKEFIGYVNSVNAYKVVNENARFIRFSFATTGSFGTALVISLTKNYKPENTLAIRRYKPKQFLVHSKPTNFNIIECWGDSRTEMVYDTHSAFTDYLQTLLGASYCVTNHGKSSQASGMISARMGSNEIFVTVENNRILASGNTHITNIYCTSGLINNFFCFSTNAPMPCVLGGVEGAIYKATYNNYSTCYFVRKTDGNAVAIAPFEKAIVPDYGTINHAVIMWWGKNDTLTAAEGRNGVEDVYNKAVQWLGHDRFIILGETASLTSAYDSGATIRTWMDEFNAKMAVKYPDNFIDINAWLSSTDALTSVGLTPTEADVECMAKGWPCESLMVYSTDQSDPTHPNTKGREAIANRIFAWMKEKHWIW